MTIIKYIRKNGKKIFLNNKNNIQLFRRKDLGAPPSAAALPPVSANGLGLPRPYAAYAAGPGSIAL
jgi:hypothetical protein